MPHGSGGGSHSGGSHSARGGSSSHSSKSSYSHLKISRRGFHHARHFIYTDRWGHEKHFYANRPPRKMSTKKLVQNLLWTIPFIFFGIMFFYMLYKEGQPPERLGAQLENTVHYEDTIGVLDQENELEEALVGFYDLTGISPYVITVHDEDWEKSYDSLEAYAYDIYVDRFEDELHFVVVYSEPSNAKELKYVDWSWEGMQGDETDVILTEKKFSRFQATLQAGLEEDTVSKAITKAFAEAGDYMMDAEVEKMTRVLFLIFGIFWNTCVVVYIFDVLKQYRYGKRAYRTA